MFFGNCWKSAFYLSLTSEKNSLSSASSGDLCQWKMVEEAVFNVFLPHNSVPLIPTFCSLHFQPWVMRNDCWRGCGLMFEWEQSWSCPDVFCSGKGWGKKFLQPEKDRTQMAAECLGGCVYTGGFPLASSREFWCSGTSLHLPSPSYSQQWHSGRCVSVQFELCFAATQAKQVLLPEPKDCSHGEEQEEEQSQETPGSCISCSCLLFSPSLSSPCPRQPQQSHGHLVPLCGCNTPLACAWGRLWASSALLWTSHFRGESNLKSSRTFLWGFSITGFSFFLSYPSTLTGFFLLHKSHI